MKREIPITVTMSLILLFVRCEYSGNKYDPNDPDYRKPSCTIDTNRSTVKINDTIVADTGSIIIGGSKDFETLFKWKIDTLDWSDWTTDDDGGTRIPLSDLAAGQLHTVKVNACYHEANTVSDSVLSFYRAEPPHITAMSDTLLAVDAGDTCIFWVKARGTGNLRYEWYQDTLSPGSKEGDSLVLREVSIADTAKPWYCRITSRWGEIISSALHVQVFYRVRYDGNDHTDGEVPIDSNRYQTGDKPDVAGNPHNLMRRGYTFSGWNDEKDGSGDDFDSSKVLRIGTKNVTLYAKWERNQCEVTFNTQGGSAVVLQTVDFNDTAKTPTQPTKNCNTFGGWFKDAQCTMAWIFKDVKIMAADTVFAKWIQDSITIIFNKNDGSAAGTMSNQTIACGMTIPLNQNAYVKTGWTFTGWAESAAGMVKFKNGTNYIGGKGRDTLYAKWISTLPTAGMVKIEAKGKTFSMGDAQDRPVHEVTFSSDFYLDTTEVTQGEYRSLMKSTYSDFSAPSWSSYTEDDKYPAFYVNWYDAALYCNALTKAVGSSDTVYEYDTIDGTPGGDDCVLVNPNINLSRSGYRLPTEAQWEYACRGGTKTDFYWGRDYKSYPSLVSDSNQVDSFAVWERNSGNLESNNPDHGPHQVATKKKNLFGLYDMSGNLAEWCNDWYGSYDTTAQTDPVGPERGTKCVVRGGMWLFNADCLRSADRDYDYPAEASAYNGFRVCLPAY